MVALAIAHGYALAHRCTTAYRQALNLDSRYRDRAFLVALKPAGFSPAQIQTAEQVLSRLRIQQSSP